MKLLNLPFKFTIRRRLILLLLMLGLLPLLAYRFAMDFQHLLLEHQARLHQHTVKNLALILESRPDLWGQTQAAGQVLSHVDLQTSSIWLVNSQGQTNYVMGQLAKQTPQSIPVFEQLGAQIIGLVGQLSGQILPYPFPQSEKPELTLIKLALDGQSSQQYRTDQQGQAVSLMSASPLYLDKQQVGAIVFEQNLNTIFNQTLRHFHYLVGLGSVLMLLVLLGIWWYSGSLSNRIMRLSRDVTNSFELERRQWQPDALIRSEPYADEITDLRQTILEILGKIASYERYLKQLPNSLRHELHNPINRLSATLELLSLESDHPRIEQAQQSLLQLQQIIQALSESSSLEQSLQNHSLNPLKVVPRLLNYFNDVQASQAPGLVLIEDQFSKRNLSVMADGFLLEQLLDKLIDNALSFNNAVCPIRIRLANTDKKMCIEVINCGPLLPVGFETQIFEGMVSMRLPNKTDEMHLGLGLYLAHLIAEFHQADLQASNWKQADLQGVSFKLSLDLLDATT
ncbi:MAG: sensor histidine kinase [Thiomicrospira sp.]|uniref:ATP-binding protein n=1 Tax=Thiomicrospira sp. TaxID=935 RepID=UPI0019EFEE66|nr:ATP-binding protein [Thiomicrospira sp.]MBE0493352.1 sensor histidine kinase [Thiomicrospira sp.]